MKMQRLGGSVILVKTVYLLYLKHPEGIAFKQLPDYRQELIDIYKTLRPLKSTINPKHRGRY